MSVKKLILPALAVTTLAGGVAGYFYLNGAPGDTAMPLGIAKVIPDEAYLAAFISTDEKGWTKLKQSLSSDAQQAYDRSFKEFQQKMLAESKIDVERDLKPWMGNMMVAMLPNSKANQPEVLMAIAIKDKVSALSFANKLKSDPKTKTVETDYKGVKITEAVSESGKSPSYTAVLKDAYLVMASNRNAIEHSIETAQGGASFATKPESAALLSQTKTGESVLARFYLPDYASSVQAMGRSSTKMSAKTLEQLKQVKSIAGTMSVDDAGLRFKGAVNVDPKLAIAFKPAPGKVVSQFPVDTLALVSGANLNAYWTQITAQAKDNPETKKVVDMMRGATQAIGLDLDNDIFGWMNGEFAIGMVPENQGMMAQLGIGQAMMFTTSDRKTAEATLGKLDSLVKAQSLQVGQRDVNGKKITEWKAPQGTLVSHGWINDNTVFIATGDQLVTNLSGQPNPALDTSDSFKSAIASLPKDNVGYFYMDVDKTMTLLNKVSRGAYTANMKPDTVAILGSVKSFGGTTTQTDQTTSQFEAVVAFKPTK